MLCSADSELLGMADRDRLTRAQAVYWAVWTWRISCPVQRVGVQTWERRQKRTVELKLGIHRHNGWTLILADRHYRYNKVTFPSTVADACVLSPVNLAHLWDISTQKNLLTQVVLEQTKETFEKIFFVAQNGKNMLHNQGITRYYWQKALHFNW